MNNGSTKWLLVSILVLITNPKIAWSTFYEKSRAGLHYSAAIMPTVSTFISSGNKIRLAQLHRAGIAVEIPYNRYLNFGFSFDYTLAISPEYENEKYTMALDKRRISSTLLGISGFVKPTLPIPFPFGDLISYLSVEGGFGSSSPIMAGAQPLSDFRYEDKTTIPSPFPLYLEATAKVGIEYFINEFLGADVGFGYRTLWLVHPMVNAPGVTNDTPDSRSALWYDVTSFYVFASLKIVF